MDKEQLIGMLQRAFRNLYYFTSDINEIDAANDLNSTLDEIVSKLDEAVSIEHLGRIIQHELTYLTQIHEDTRFLDDDFAGTIMRSFIQQVANLTAVKLPGEEVSLYYDSSSGRLRIFRKQ